MYYNYDVYSYRDTINYYRLKQTDFDGAYETFKVIAIDNRSHGNRIVKRVSLMGIEVRDDYVGFIIEVYSDGTTRKVFK